jgi:hypothetical protein
MSVTDQFEPELVHVESQAPLHVANENGEKVNAKVRSYMVLPKSRLASHLRQRGVARRRDYSSHAASFNG